MRYKIKVTDECTNVPTFEINEIVKFKIRSDNSEFLKVKHCFKIKEKVFCEQQQDWIYGGKLYVWEHDTKVAEIFYKVGVPQKDLYKCPKPEDFFIICKQTHSKRNMTYDIRKNQF